MPNILITNDDGIHAPGLRALAVALAEVGTVTIVAPSRERSAAAQSLTLRQPIYCDQIAEREYAIEGTPADAMILAFHTLLKEKPDLVVSGINRGGNVGENIYYSGTVGAAMEGGNQSRAGGSGFRRVPRAGVRFRACRGLRAHARAADSERRPARGRAAERQRAAGLDGRGAHHAAIVEDHAQRAAARNRPARPALLLAERAAVHRRHRARIPTTPRFATAPSRSRRCAVDHTHTPSLEHLSRWTKLLEATSRR